MIEQCLMGEDSNLFQQQIYQQNYIQWFQPKDLVINPTQKKDTKKTTATTTTSGVVEHPSPIEDTRTTGSNDANNNDKIPDTTDNDMDGSMDHPIVQSTSHNNNNSIMTTSTLDLLQDFAPVSSKWSDCQSEDGGTGTGTGSNDHLVPQLQIQRKNHIIDLVLLRKLVAVGYGLDDNDDNDDDDDYDPHDPLDGPSESPRATPVSTRMNQSRKGYRAMAWRVLLGFLPLDTHQWLLLHSPISATTTNTATENNDENENEYENNNDDDHDVDDDNDIKEVNTSGLTTDSSNDNNKTMVQQHRELYISLVQELFVSVDDVTTKQAIELCGRNNKQKNQYGRRLNHGRSRDNDTSMSSNISRTSSSSSLFSMNDPTATTSSTVTNMISGMEEVAMDTNDHTDPIEPTTTTANIVSTQLQQYWKERSLDPYILERCCVTNHNLNNSSSNIHNSTNLNILRIQNDDHYWNNQTNNHNNHTMSDTVAATITTTASSDEDSINMIKQDNLQDFVDNVLLLDEIRKDVIRTHPDWAFFLDPNVGIRRYAAIERILFVWSKYNKGVRYVQGMNEIVGILYYVLANDQNDEWSVWAEADTFWLFNALIGGDDMRDVFISGFDEHDTGIHGRLITMQQLLQRHDPEVSEHLQDLGIEISFYAIRWWTTLLCREFLLPDTIRLWDSMFASTHKDNFLRYVCVIMVMSIRDRLLKGDFTICLQLLQDFPSTSVDQLLEASRALWIYESQISVACHRGGLTLHQALTTIESPKALIMAFGFVNGTPPPPASILKNPIVDDIKTASVQIEATVRRSATIFLGRAKGWYNRYNNNSNSNNTNDDSKDQGNKNTSTEEDVQPDDPAKSINEADDIYMKAFLEA